MIQKQEPKTLSNELVAMVDLFFIEKISINGLQKRSKKTGNNKEGRFYNKNESKSVE